MESLLSVTSLCKSKKFARVLYVRMRPARAKSMIHLLFIVQDRIKNPCSKTKQDSCSCKTLTLTTTNFLKLHFWTYKFGLVAFYVDLVVERLHVIVFRFIKNMKSVSHGTVVPQQPCNGNWVLHASIAKSKAC